MRRTVLTIFAIFIFMLIPADALAQTTQGPSKIKGTATNGLSLEVTGPTQLDSSLTVTGAITPTIPIAIGGGGTGASTAAGALANLGITIVSLLDYGAVCDGITDDRVAIGNAIVAASLYPAATSIYVPDGRVCVVGSNPSPGGYIYTIAANNVGFSGNGTIKIGNSIGNYRCLFDYSGAPDNITIENLTIDGNATNNPVNTSPFGTNEHVSFMINGAAAQNVTVQNVNIINGNDESSVSLNNCNDCTITNNHWSNMGIGGTFVHDSSEIYLTGSGGSVTGNTFQGAGLGVRTAIEVHQDTKLVQGNVVSNYQQCIITSANQAVVHDINVIGNVCANVDSGVDIWAVDGAYLGLTISDNTISINRGANPWTVNGSESGIRTYPGNTYSITDFLISGNNIRYISDTLSTIGYMGGISILSDTTTASAPMTHLDISNNTIESPLCAGIVFQNASVFTDVHVHGNSVHNPGGRSATAPESCYSNWQSGLTITNATGWANSVVENNYYSDDQIVATMAHGVYWLGVSGDNASLGMVFGEDKINFKTLPVGISTPYYEFYYTAPEIHIRIPNFTRNNALFPSQVTGSYPSPGSSIFDYVTGRTYTQAAAAVPGYQLVSTETRQSVPSDLTTYAQGDLIVNSISTGSIAGWVFNGTSFVPYGANAASLSGLVPSGSGASLCTGPASGLTPGNVAYFNGFGGCALKDGGPPPLNTYNGVTGSIGGSSVAPGSNTSGGSTVVGAVSGSVCHATSTNGTSAPGYPFILQAYGSGTNAAAVVIWNYGTTAQTPTATTYNVRCNQ